MEDRWIHRSRDMRCQTCMWFVPKQTPAGHPRDIGRCRKHAPTMDGYPVVFDEDWCGDHKLDHLVFVDSGADMTLKKTLERVGNPQAIGRTDGSSGG